MIDLTKIAASSKFHGFKNYDEVSFSNSWAGGSIPAGEYRTISCLTAINNDNAVTQVDVRFTGLESFYRTVNGYFQVDYPSGASRQYSIQVLTYYQGGSVHLDAYIINQVGVAVVVPAITFDVTAKLYHAPF